MITARCSGPRGEQGTPVVFVKNLPTRSEEGEESDLRFVARASSAFNVEQVLDPARPEVER